MAPAKKAVVTKKSVAVSTVTKTKSVDTEISHLRMAQMSSVLQCMLTIVTLIALSSLVPEVMFRLSVQPSPQNTETLSLVLNLLPPVLITVLSVWTLFANVKRTMRIHHLESMQ